MATQNLLYKTSVPINEHIQVKIPTVGEIIDNEEAYYSLLTMFTAMPVDMMVQLDDIGLDFTQLNEYELFLILFDGIKTQDTSLFFGDLDLSNFSYAINEQNGEVVLVDPTKDIIIDRLIHEQIANTLRNIHHLEKNTKTPGNTAAKKYMIERARIKAKRRKNKKEVSQLESLIVAMVNTEQYKYDFTSTRNLTVYQFNECVRQILKKEDYEHKMHGIYAGTVSAKDLSQDELNWLIH